METIQVLRVAFAIGLLVLGALAMGVSALAGWARRREGARSRVGTVTLAERRA
jgi:hypothetical protein